MTIQDSYDAAASAYAEHLADELAAMPVRRHLLNRFAEAIRGGRCADLGCGPGQVARYLHDQRIEAIGIDLSPRMVEVARALHPAIDFRVGDLRRLELADASLAGIVAFYAIVHSDAAELAQIFAEFRRVLAPGGLALVSFHVGDEVHHVDDLFGAPVSLEFRFHRPAIVADLLAAAGLPVIEATEREPYPGVEYASRRCYLLATRRLE